MKKITALVLLVSFSYGLFAQAAIKNFSIPIIPTMGPALGTKPQLKDSLITLVVFKSSAVVFRTRNGRGGYDDTQEWTLTLTPNTFRMQCPQSDKTYTVLGAKYDDKLHVQLADETGQFTHILGLGYFNENQRYSAIMGSVDHKEDYQFQGITIQEVKHSSHQINPSLPSTKGKTTSALNSETSQVIQATEKGETFELKFSTFERYILSSGRYTPEKIKESLKPTYLFTEITESPQAMNEREGEWEWEFQDKSKSWEAFIFVQFDEFKNGMQKVKELQFTVPQLRVREYKDELNSSGYTYIGNENGAVFYQNRANGLGAKIQPYVDNLYLMRLYILQ